MLRRTAVRASEAASDFVATTSNALLISLCTLAITSIFLSMETSRAFWIILGLGLGLPKLLPERAQPSRALG